MIEYATTEPHPSDIGGCAHCAHCDGRGPVTDCPSCGDDRCAACAAVECREPVACSCGRTVEGRSVRWDDCDPYCDDCDPMTECDAGSLRCGAVVRRHEIAQVVVDGEGYELCRECRGEEG